MGIIMIIINVFMTPFLAVFLLEKNEANKNEVDYHSTLLKDYLLSLVINTPGSWLFVRIIATAFKASISIKSGAYTIFALLFAVFVSYCIRLYNDEMQNVRQSRLDNANMLQKSGHKRGTWVDVAKGIAMLSVMLGHVNGGVISGLDLGFVYAFELTVFFILSGYFLKRTRITAEYLSDRFKRLMVPYLYTCVALLVWNIIRCNGSLVTVTWVIRYFFTTAFHASGVLRDMGGGIIFDGAIGAIWFLPAMFLALVFTQLILNLIENDYVRIATAVALYLLGIILTNYMWLPFSIQSAMTSVIFVLFGYYYREKELDEKIKIWMYPVFVAVFIIGVILKWDTIYIADNTYNDVIISPIISIIGSLIVFGISKLLVNSRVLSFMGKNYLFFMCVHLFTINSFADYFEQIIARSGLSEKLIQWGWVACYIVFGCVGGVIVYAVNYLLKHNALKEKALELIPVSNKNRDLSTDVCKGLLIFVMMLGHDGLDGDARKVIYSFHMAAFVLLSGLFYKPERSVKDTLKRMLKTFMMPYLFFCIWHFCLYINNGMSVLSRIKYYACGMSFSNKLLQDVDSVGPVYFVLVLFVTRLLYTMIDKINVDIFFKTLIVFAVSYLGVVIGEHGYWLPWSFDVAMYCIIFYHAGYWFKKMGTMDYVKNNPWIYFLLSPVWAYAIFTSAMEIAGRNYRPYGMVIFGAICGFLLFYLWSCHVNESFPVAARILSLVGQQTIFILIFHALMSGRVRYSVSDIFGLSMESCILSCIAYLVQAIVGVCLGYIWDYLQKKVELKLMTFYQNERVIKS